jgi:hypothetical protein
MIGEVKAKRKSIAKVRWGKKKASLTQARGAPGAYGDGEPREARGRSRVMISPSGSLGPWSESKGYPNPLLQ